VAVPQFRLGLEIRLSRDERKKQTRERLLDAATRVFARRGFASATLDEVAEAAGFTKGAVYSNFESKSDLFIALAERRIQDQTEVAASWLDGLDLADAARTAARRDGPGSRVDVDWMALACEFWLYARHDDRAREAMARRYETARSLSAQMLAAKYAEAGIEPPVPARDLAIAIEALGVGMLFQHAVDPAGVSMDLLAAMVSRILGLPPEPAGSEGASVPDATVPTPPPASAEGTS
jgi:AcrR family transcriptional regulator